MSMGWMTQVAAIPDRPPFRNGLTVVQTGDRAGFGLLSEAIDPQSAPNVSKIWKELQRTRAACL
jgi:hypothetical protein